MSDLSPGASPSARRVTKPTPPTANGTSDPMQDLLHALQAMRAGDFSVRMTGDHIGIEGIDLVAWTRACSPTAPTLWPSRRSSTTVYNGHWSTPARAGSST